jgi:hypothetical protein
MTSVLYSAGLNYQSGNPVRQEIVAVRREVDSLRKQLELVTEENLIYRKHIMKLLQATDGGAGELTNDIMALSAKEAALAAAASSSNSGANRSRPGGGTVQGAGFSR